MWIRFLFSALIVAGILLMGSSFAFDKFLSRFFLSQFHWAFSAGMMAYLFAHSLPVARAKPTAIFAASRIAATCARLTIRRRVLRTRDALCGTVHTFHPAGRRLNKAGGGRRFCQETPHAHRRRAGQLELNAISLADLTYDANHQTNFPVVP